MAQRPIRQVHSQPPATAPMRTPLPVAGNPSLTHPGRVLWPPASNIPSVTKADLATYYTRYAERILPHVAGRPLSILRAPSGIEASVFLQRHPRRGQSPLVRQVKVRGQARPYLCIDTAEALVALAQVAAVELHPWGALAEALDTPDRLIFDLDPAEGLGFDSVIAAAHDLRARLEATGLAPYAKVTGGKGMHLVVPLAGDANWPEAKDFARRICAAAANEAPARYTVATAKAKRTGRIFLDYLRNDLLATAIAPWSPRARPGAPVARPVAWGEVGEGLAPDRWHLPDLLHGPLGPDPWRDFAAAAVPLRAAVARLGSEN